LNQHIDYATNNIKLNPSLLGIKDFKGMTPLHCAAMIGNTELCSLILTYNRSCINNKNDDGNTPLLLTIEALCTEGEESTAALLLSAGANLEAEIFSKLIDYAIDRDIVVYIRIAF